MFVFATLSLLATTSRQLWAFARDAAIPNARIIAYVHPRMKVPVISIVVSASITCLLSLINIGSAAVFNAIVSLTVAGIFGSYLIPFTLFMHKRVCHPLYLTPGPWTLGRFGPYVNGFAIIWSTVMMMFSFWPASVPVTAITMNWSCVLWSGVVIFAIGFWFIHGKSVYQGPVMETNVEEAAVRREV
jgi:choline transport protein